MRNISIFSPIFWGIILVLAGILMILNYIFKLNIPVLKFLFGFILVYIGISLIFGFKGFYRIRSYNDGKTSVFSEMNIKPETIDKEYNIIFSKANIDLSNLSSDDIGKYIEINCVFGSSIIKIPSNLPIKIIGSTVFGNVSLPNNQHNSFGDINFKSSESDNYIYIDVNVVFGSIYFEY
jgi:predicted membrane protein